MVSDTLLLQPLKETQQLRTALEQKNGLVTPIVVDKLLQTLASCTGHDNKLGFDETAADCCRLRQQGRHQGS